LKKIFGKLIIFKALLIISMSDVIGQSPDLFYALEFAENKGQWGDSFQYRVELGYGAYFLHPDGFTVLKHDTSDYARLLKTMHKFGASDDPSTGSNSLPNGNALTLRSHAYRVRFLGANRKASAVPENPIQENINYFLGDDPSRWKSGLSSYSRVTYHDVYPNIDVTYKSEAGYLKYDIIVNPGADISQIRLDYDGADKLTIEKGRLIIKTSTGQNRELDPYTYQIVGGMKRQVSCKYVVKGSEVRFELKGYDPTQPLVIDPTLVFGSYTGSRASNWGYTATPGPDRSFFAGGIVFGTGYPTTTGAVQTFFGRGNVDIGITRFSPNGNARMYSTYIGGNGDDIPHSLISDGSGNLVILGRSNSSNYPRRGYTSANARGTDIVVTKLNATGTALMGSAIIGGSGSDGANIDDPISASTCRSLLYNYGDNSRSEVILDDAGNVYIAANTQSSDFPMVNPFQRTIGGAQDAVVCKLDPNLNSLLFSSYLGGSGDDGGFCIKVHPTTNDIYVAGPTLSKDFPGNKTGTIGAVPGLDIDGFVAVIPNSGGSIIRSTYLATNEIDIVYGLQFDKNGFPYVMGISLGAWPVLNAAYSNPGAKQFISKLKPDLSGYEYSTVYGTNSPLPNISPVAFLVDRCENVYVSGWGGKLNPCDQSSGCYDRRTSGTFGLPITPDAIKRSTDDRDFYFIVIQRNASQLLFGSFAGQSGGEGDHVDGGTSRFDDRGAIYQAVCANCGGSNMCPTQPVTIPFPITPGVVGPRNGALGSRTSGECNLGAIKIDFDFDGVEAGLGASIEGLKNDTTGCFPLTVEFEDTVGTGKTFIWEYGDGTKNDTTNSPYSTHTFQNPGNFRVKLIAVNNDECVTRDSSYRTIIVGTDKAEVDFSSFKLPPCANFSMQFDNLSVAPARVPFSSNSFIWDFGDGSPKRTTGPGPVVHTFPAQGVYNVKLTIEDIAYCNAPVTVTKTVRMSTDVTANFSMAPDPACTPLTYQFKNLSFNGQTFTWDFGDGTTFTGFAPPLKTYATTGTYRVKLTATDPNTCNVTDDTTMTLVVLPGTPPVAAFTYSPNPSLENTPTQFINASTNAIRYRWDFGDGNGSTQANPQHQYVASAINDVCLTAINSQGCENKVCQKVESLIVIYYDVPNAFTPNGDGKNDKVGVRGFGIVKMNFRIFNRWGQLVFQSTDPSQGWDGYYQGRLQPMDVYGYTLEVEMYSGDKYTKKGDITLLR
jgi:gliding motility-associated-like protein